MTCKAIRQGDQMCCGKCGLQWDIDDLDRPQCLIEPVDSGRGALDELHTALETNDFKSLPSTLATHSEQVDSALAAYNRLIERATIERATIERATIERCASAFDAILLRALQADRSPEFPVGFLRGMVTAYPDKEP